MQHNEASVNLEGRIFSKQETSALDRRIDKLLVSSNHKVILTVALESCHPNRTRHLAIISAPVANRGPVFPLKLIRSDPLRQSSPATCVSRTSSARVKMDRNSPSVEMDYCLIGLDTWKDPCQDGKEQNEVTTIGFVSKVLLGTAISLDGDGGFGVHVLQRHFIFKPVTLQNLWTTIQTLHAISARLKPKRNSMLVEETDWVVDYQTRVTSPQSCINEWNAMPDLLSKRPMSPDQLSVLSRDAANAETKKTVIKSKLREIMKTVDLDDITSKSIRLRLESDLDQKLEEFKAFIDEEILLILGQMDPASRILDFLYLGSEWNASNLEELNSNGITHILNVTREIDNFFPTVFKYLNIREYDVEETDLLKYWDETYNFIHTCREMGGRVLVHCKMGISRSASTVCAFLMKYFGWSLDKALSHTKERRGIINPNKGFRLQLSVYEGILGASSQRRHFRKIQRSKSDSSVKKAQPGAGRLAGHSRQCSQGSEGSPGVEAAINRIQGSSKKRPASWSPPEHVARRLGLTPEQELETGPPLSPGCHSPGPSPVVYHCYTHLAALLAPQSPGFPGNLQLGSPPSTVPLPSTVQPSTVRTDCYRLPGAGPHPGPREEPLEEGLEGMEGVGWLPAPTNGPLVPPSSSCPAHDHINQCTCNFELELKVSDDPVDLFSQTGETDVILRKLGNFPIHMRQSQYKATPTALGDPGTTPSPPLEPAVAPNLLNDASNLVDTDDILNRLDTSGAEELSVKTLADMFDFKLGEQPLKPPLAKSKDKLVISRLGLAQANRPLLAASPSPNLSDCSEC